MQDFRKLAIWSRSKLLTIKIYDLTSTFPREEVYGITSQLRRAAISIPTNIAEGSSRTSVKDFANFLNIALGSLCELDNLIEISHDLKYIRNIEELNSEINEIRRMLISFKSKLKT